MKNAGDSMKLRFSTVAIALGVLFVALATRAERASAQSLSAGAVTLVGLIGGDEKGGGAIADFYAEFGRARLGAGLGVGVITNPDGERSRVFTPVGLSAAYLVGDPGGAGLELRGRAGLWGGATDQGLRSGAWGSVGLWGRFGLGARAALLVGCDLWLQSASDRVFYVAPGLGFSWMSP